MLGRSITETASVPAWNSDELAGINTSFRHRSAEDLLDWATARFGQQIVLTCSFGGASGMVLLDMIARIGCGTPVVFLDTDLLFPETYALRDELAVRLDLRFIRVHSGLSLETQAAEYSPALWSREPNLCCYLRKVEPLRRFLATQRAWITGIRRDQTPARTNAGLVEWDHAYGLVKLNPLIDWRIEQVWAYIHAHHLPFNRLHRQGYPSIGCWPCTQPVVPGDDPRAGRWPGWDKSDCGIHLQPQRK